MPWTSFLTKFMGVWPKDSREKYGPDYFRLTLKNVGTGPGIFEEWKPNDYVSFRRNPDYWQKRLPHWDRLVVKIVPEGATRVAFLLSGQADIIGAPPPREFSRLKSHKGIHGEANPTFGGWTVLLQNPTRPPFDDVEFRRAIAHAVDRTAIAEKIFYGLVEPTAIPAPVSNWWFDPEANAGVTISIHRGGILGLVGESGCGKSTLAQLTVGLLPPTRGHIEWDGADLGRRSRRSRSDYRRGVQMVFQDTHSSLNPRKRVGTVLTEALPARGLEKQGRAGRVAALLRQVGLDKQLSERFPHELSGGQRQRWASRVPSPWNPRCWWQTNRSPRWMFRCRDR